MDTMKIGQVAEVLLAMCEAEPGDKDQVMRLYAETCRAYGFDPDRMPARLREPFMRIFGAYVCNKELLGAPTHGDLLCLYLGIMVAAREYEWR